jgi:hypothetical protein
MECRALASTNESFTNRNTSLPQSPMWGNIGKLKAFLLTPPSNNNGSPGHNCALRGQYTRSEILQTILKLTSVAVEYNSHHRFTPVKGGNALVVEGFLRAIVAELRDLPDKCRRTRIIRQIPGAMTTERAIRRGAPGLKVKLRA